MKNQIYSALFIFFITLCFLGFIFMFLRNKNVNESLENITENSLEIVISRYNEDLKWLQEVPFNQYPVIVYNKGSNQDFYHAPNIKQIIHVKNVGRCDHTYLYHIIQNYDNLAEITIFLPGSAQMEHKLPKAKSQVIECAKYNNTVIIKDNASTSYHPNGIQSDFYHFQLDDWVSTDNTNKALNTEEKLLPAEIRPFGKWYEARFPNINVKYVSYLGILGISKKHILQHPKSYYESLIQELSTHSNPEVGHYFERSWAAIFTPNNDAVIV